MTEQSYTTREVMENQVMPAMRNMMLNVDVDSDLRTMLDQGSSASEDVKNKVAQRYLAPYFGDNKESQMMLIDQILKASSDKEKIDLLKQFLEGIPASNNKFNPKTFLEDVSRDISATEKPKIAGLQTGEVLESDEVSPLTRSAEPEFVNENFKIKIKTKSDVKANAEGSSSADMHANEDGKRMQQHFQPLPQRGKTYEQIQVESAKISMPEQSQMEIVTKRSSQPSIPDSPMDAKEERENMKEYGEAMDEAQGDFVKELFGSRKEETEEKTQQRKKGISGAVKVAIGSVTVAGGVTGMSLWFT